MNTTAIKERLVYVLINKEKIVRWGVVSTIIVMLYSLSLFIWDVYPLGEFGLGMVDFQHQYIPFFTYYRENLFSGDFNYTFSLGMGNDLYGLFFYYLASPLNLILFLFPVSKIQLGIYIVLMTKFILMGILTSIYLERYKISSMQNGFLSLVYAMSGYAVVNFQSPMWLDALYILPLLLLTINKIIEDNKYIPFILVYAYAIFTNFYMAFMLGILSILFFTYQYALHQEFKPKQYIFELFKYGCSAVTSALLMVIPLYVTLHSLGLGKTSVDYVENYSVYTNLLDIFSKFYIGSNGGNQISEGLPNIYVPTTVITLVILFFGIKSISKKEKLLTLGFIVSFLAIFYTPLANYVLHGMSYPIWFLYRYSYVFSFLLIMIAARTFERFDQITYSKKKVCALILINIGYAIYSLNQDFDYVYDFSIYITTAFILIDVVLFYLLIKKGDYKKSKIPLLLFMFGFYQLIGNTVLSGLNIYSYTQRDTQQEQQTFKETMTKASETIEDSDLYRTGITFEHVTNDNMLLGTAGLTGFSSTMTAKSYHALMNFGYGSTSRTPTNATYYGGNYFTDSLFNVKYVIAPDTRHFDRIPSSLLDYTDNSFLVNHFEKDLMKNYLNYYDKKTFEGSDLAIYKNNQAIGLGFIQKGNLNPKLNSNPFSNLNTLANNVFGYEVFEKVPFELEMVNLEKVKDYYKPINSKEDSYLRIKYSKTDGLDYYASNGFQYVDNYENDDIPFTIRSGNNDITSKQMMSTNPVLLKDDGDSSVVEVKVFGNEDVEIHGFTYEPMVYKMDTEQLTKQLDNIKGTFKISEHTNNHIKGSVESEENSHLVTTLPYDDFWKVTVNNKEVDIVESYGSLLTIPLETGKNAVELEYGIPNKSQILLVSISLLSFIVICYRFKKEKD